MKKNDTPKLLFECGEGHVVSSQSDLTLTQCPICEAVKWCRENKINVR